MENKIDHGFHVCRLCLASKGDAHLKTLFDDDWSLTKKYFSICGIEVALHPFCWLPSHRIVNYSCLTILTMVFPHWFVISVWKTSTRLLVLKNFEQWRGKLNSSKKFTSSHVVKHCRDLRKKNQLRLRLQASSKRSEWTHMRAKWKHQSEEREAKRSFQWLDSRPQQFALHATRSSFLASIGNVMRCVFILKWRTFSAMIANFLVSKKQNSRAICCAITLVPQTSTASTRKFVNTKRNRRLAYSAIKHFSIGDHTTGMSNKSMWELRIISAICVRSRHIWRRK